MASLVIGLAVLADLNRHEWFFGDDWDFLLDRGLHHATFGLWTPHNEHWSTLPILEFRAAFSLDGLHSAVLTFGVLLLAHVVLAHLIWRISLRCGADPWIATGLATIFVLLGSGAENLTWDFQIGFVGAVLFGFLSLQSDRLRLTGHLRLVATWFLLVCSLMCSGIGITMTIAAGVDQLCRHRVRRAAATVSVPAATYLVWYALAGRKGLAGDHVTLTSVLLIPSYLWTGLSSALGTTLGLEAAGPFLLLALVGWAIKNSHRFRTSQGTALALGSATVVLFVVIGTVRTPLGASQATASRYTYVAVALLTPMIAVALSDLVKTTMASARLTVLGLLVIILVANLGSLRSFSDNHTQTVIEAKTRILAAAQVLADGDVALTTQPEPTYSPNITSTSLLRVARAGQLPHEPLTATDIVTAQSIINVSLTSSPALAGHLEVHTPAAGRHATCVTAPIVQIPVPKGGGSITLRSSQPAAETLGVTLRGATGVSAPTIDLTLPPGMSTLNLSASGTTATIQTSSSPGVTYCPEPARGRS
jgi:hypothetical protein